MGTRDFSHPERTVEDFDETIDDFALATTALSLKAIALDAAFYTHCGGTDRLLFSADDYRDLSQSQTWVNLQQLMWDKELATLASQFLAALSQKTLQHLSFRLFNLSKPKAEELDYIIINEPTPNSDFHIQFKDGNCLYFKYDKEDESKVWVVAPEYMPVPCEWPPEWHNYAKPIDQVAIPHNIVNHQVIGIEWRAFFGCNSLLSIVIPDSVTGIGKSIFEGCYSLQSINIPDSVTQIGYAAFRGCSSLQSIVIPDSVTEIGNSAFSGCSSLQSIVIPDSVTEIGWYAFYRCISMHSIVIPDSVKKIGTDAFFRCSNLQSIKINTPQLLDGSRDLSRINILPNVVGLNYAIINEETYCSDFHIQFKNGNCLYFKFRNDSYGDYLELVPPGLTTYNSAPNFYLPNGDSVDIPSWEGFEKPIGNIIVPKAINQYPVRSILYAAFDGCTQVKTISLPESIVEIGSNSFINCVALQSIIMPNSVTIIMERTFKNCTSLQSIIIPDSVTQIEEEAFSHCSSLQSIDIPNSVTVISEMAFSHCSNLRSIVIPDSVRVIANHAFSDCTSLQSIKIKNPKLLEGTGVDLQKVKIITD